MILENLLEALKKEVIEQLRENLIRKRVIRSGRRKVVRKTTSKGFKVTKSGERKMTTMERIKRRKGARRAVIKRRAKKSQSLAKFRRSMRMK